MNAEDFENFQAEVFELYLMIKRLRMQEVEFERLSECPPDGWFNRFFFRMSIFLGRLGFAKGRKDPEAMRLLSDEEVKGILCECLKGMRIESESDERDAVRKIVGALAAAIDAGSVRIPMNKDLFAGIAYESTAEVRQISK